MVDVDDVIFPTMMSIHDLALAAGLHDGTVEPTWSGWEVYTLPGGGPCPPEVYWDLWSDFALANGYLVTPPIEGAAESLRRLHYAGHKIHMVTARGDLDHGADIKRWTAEWLEEFAIPHDSLTFASDKVKAMWTVLDQGVFDYAIDDRAKNVAGLRDAGVDAYLLTHAHNRAVAGLPRIETVDAFVDLIIEENR